MARTALAAVGVLAGRAARGAVGVQNARTLAFLNTHTGERLRATYWERGDYLPDALSDIDRILRDHRSGEVHRIEPRLLDLLHAVHQQLEAPEPFHLISGYRSHATNARLQRAGRGVASRSLHVLGWAADVRLPRVASTQLRDAARQLRGGGVGYYRDADFVHVDVGRVRYW